MHLVNRTACSLASSCQLTGNFICTPGSSCARRSCHHNIPSNKERHPPRPRPPTPPGFTSIQTTSQITQDINERAHGRSTANDAQSPQYEDMIPVRVEIPGLARDGEWLAAGHCPLRLEPVEQAQSKFWRSSTATASYPSMRTD